MEKWTKLKSNTCHQEFLLLNSEPRKGQEFLFSLFHSWSPLVSGGFPYPPLLRLIPPRVEVKGKEEGIIRAQEEGRRIVLVAAHKLWPELSYNQVFLTDFYCPTSDNNFHAPRGYKTSASSPTPMLQEPKRRLPRGIIIRSLINNITRERVSWSLSPKDCLDQAVSPSASKGPRMVVLRWRGSSSATAPWCATPSSCHLILLLLPLQWTANKSRL